MTLFGASIQNPNVKVKTATLKAITAFLSSIDEEEEVLKYNTMMP
jgi:hypothetical protein